MDPEPRYTILVVDDEPHILTSLQRLLRREFVVLSAGSGQEALALLRAHEVQLILSDQRMAGMTGTEFLAQAKGAYPDAIRLLLTGYADATSMIAAINAGQIYRYLVKPWDPDELLATMREAAGKYRLIVQNRRLVEDLIAANAVLEQRVAERTADLARENVALIETQRALAGKSEKLAELYAEVRHLSVTDPLTGLPNRRGFTPAAQEEVARARRLQLPLSVLMLDLDHFKTVNDSYGHEAGDAVLASFGACCRKHLRPMDILERYGGDEFAAVLVETDQRTALGVAERLRAAVAELAVGRDENPSPAHITISVGVATLAESCPDLTTLLVRADRALYAAKQAGRDQVAVWTGALPSDAAVTSEV